MIHFLRGGSNNIKSVLEETTNTTTASLLPQDPLWKTFFTRISNLNPFISNTKKNAKVDPSTMILVQSVIAPTSVVPPTVIQECGHASGIIGSILSTEKVQQCAKLIHHWYRQHGYVLHAVTGATLNVDNGTATLYVQEPIVNDIPLTLTFAKQVPLDPETGEHTTLTQYRSKLERRRGMTNPLPPEEWNDIVASLNTTLVEAKGRTKQSIISKRLGLHPGTSFQWNTPQWQRIASSTNIFTNIWSAAPTRMDDGTVQVQVVAQEAPPRNLEYGVSKSLYTGKWEGELDFVHDNVGGAGETLSFNVRRGARDSEASVRVRFLDDKFGMEGGYEAEVFKEYIATDGDHNDDDDDDLEEEAKRWILELPSTLSDKEETLENETEVKESFVVLEPVNQQDRLLSRKGFKYSLRNPVPKSLVRRSTVSGSVERTSTAAGLKENIASVNLNLGPIRKDLPPSLDIKNDIKASITTGTRIGEKVDSQSVMILPYTSATVTARQVIPLRLDLFPKALVTNTSRDIVLALQHTLLSSTRNLPQHEANAAGFAARVRGYSSDANGPIGSSLVGSTEVRIPFKIPLNREDIVQDGDIVIFGDYMTCNRRIFYKNDERLVGNTKKKELFKLSVGVGLRKSLQGVPIKYDMSLTSDGKFGASFSLGRDWEI